MLMKNPPNTLHHIKSHKYPKFIHKNNNISVLWGHQCTAEMYCTTKKTLSLVVTVITCSFVR